ARPIRCGLHRLVTYRPLLSPNFDAGSWPKPGSGASRTCVVTCHKFDPQCVTITIVRGISCVTQCSKASLLHSGICACETRELKNHRRTFVHLSKSKRYSIPRRVHPDFRSAAYRSLTSVLKLSAIPAQDDRFWSWPVPWTGSSGSARTSSTAAACSSKPSESTRAARTTYRPYADATKVPAAYGSVPERLDFTSFFV